MQQDYLEMIREAIASLDLEKALQYTREALEAGVGPQEIILRGVTQGLELVGKKFESSEYFLSELIASGEIAREITKIVKPRLKNVEMKSVGKVAIGTVRGDLHDIGKNVVSMVLEAAGFQVLDLGADVTPERFVEAVKYKRPDIIGMSCLLTISMPEMKLVIDAIRSEGLREQVKVIVGGAPVTSEFAEGVGADGYAANAIEAVKLCKELM